MWGRRKKGEARMSSTKVVHHGRSFMSKLEAATYSILLAREHAGEIKDIKCQVRVYYFKNPDIYSILDFSFIDCATESLCYAESKGFPSESWKIKQKLYIHLIPHRLEMWGGSYTKPRLTEVINGHSSK